MKKILLIIGAVCCLSNSYAYAGDHVYDRKDFVRDMRIAQNILLNNNSNDCYTDFYFGFSVNEAMNFITNNPKVFIDAYNKLDPVNGKLFYGDNLVVFQVLNEFLTVKLGDQKDMKRFNDEFCLNHDVRYQIGRDFQVEAGGLDY